MSFWFTYKTTNGTKLDVEATSIRGDIQIVSVLYDGLNIWPTLEITNMAMDLQDAAANHYEGEDHRLILGQNYEDLLTE